MLGRCPHWVLWLSAWRQAPWGVGCVPGQPELGWLLGGDGEQQQCVKADNAVRSPHSSMGQLLPPTPAHCHPLHAPCTNGGWKSFSRKNSLGVVVWGVCATWLLWGWLGKPGISTGHLNPEVASAARPRSLSLGMGGGHSTG